MNSPFNVASQSPLSRRLCPFGVASDLYRQPGHFPADHTVTKMKAVVLRTSSARDKSQSFPAVTRAPPPVLQINNRNFPKPGTFLEDVCSVTCLQPDRDLAERSRA